MSKKENEIELNTTSRVKRDNDDDYSNLHLRKVAEELFSLDDNIQMGVISQNLLSFEREEDILTGKLGRLMVDPHALGEIKITGDITSQFLFTADNENIRFNTPAITGNKFPFIQDNELSLDNLGSISLETHAQSWNTVRLTDNLTAGTVIDAYTGLDTRANHLCLQSEDLISGNIGHITVDSHAWPPDSLRITDNFPPGTIITTDTDEFKLSSQANPFCLRDDDLISGTFGHATVASHACLSETIRITDGLTHDSIFAAGTGEIKLNTQADFSFTQGLELASTDFLRVFNIPEYDQYQINQWVSLTCNKLDDMFANDDRIGFPVGYDIGNSITPGINITLKIYYIKTINSETVHVGNNYSICLQLT